MRLRLRLRLLVLKPAVAAAASLWQLLCGGVVVVREVHEIALGQTDPGRTKLPTKYLRCM
jgi:hypothetical protein